MEAFITTNLIQILWQSENFLYYTNPTCKNQRNTNVYTLSRSDCASNSKRREVWIYFKELLPVVSGENLCSLEERCY